MADFFPMKVCPFTFIYCRRALFYVMLLSLTLLHSERPKLYTFFAFLSALGLIIVLFLARLDEV